MIPFSPNTVTAALTVGTSAASLTLPAASGTTPGGPIQCMLTNIGPNVVWVSATTTAAIPTSGGTSASFPVAPGAQAIFTLPANATLSCIASATGNTLYATQGIGA